VILSDVTREKKSAEQRIEDERTSSILLLAGGVAHELGNPLNSLTIHLQLIARKLKKLKASRESDSIAESVDVCREEVARLDGIITHFLDAVRPSPPDLAETSLSEVLAEVLKFQKREFADRGIAVEAETPAALPTVMADRGQLKQVFFNITKNAMEAMEPGGKLKIKSRADDDSVYLLFGDSGSGIRQEDLGRLFQPYHTTKRGGHGLGLMIVQRIMHAHGGDVSIESRTGLGTIVTLQFPRKDRRVRMLRG
jgi:signal transduction histidine kinase